MKVAALLLVCSVPACALLYNIDQPTPMSLAHGEYFVSARLWGAGGIMARFGIGLFNRLTLGVSYGGNKLIGGETPEFFDRGHPDFQARLAILTEQGYVPDLSLGFESQGYDDCIGGRYVVQEKGGYLAVGKTLGTTRTYVEAGFNYWNGPSGFITIAQMLPASFEVIAEYDPALNDVIEGQQQTQGYGFLNAGVAWTFNDQVRFGISVRDILGNSGDGNPDTRLNRVIDLSYVDQF